MLFIVVIRTIAMIWLKKYNHARFLQFRSLERGDVIQMLTYSVTGRWPLVILQICCVDCLAKHHHKKFVTSLYIRVRFAITNISFVCILHLHEWSVKRGIILRYLDCFWTTHQVHSMATFKRIKIAEGSIQFSDEGYFNPKEGGYQFYYQ
jgi:hypothetical protein